MRETHIYSMQKDILHHLQIKTEAKQRLKKWKEIMMLLEEDAVHNTAINLIIVQINNCKHSSRRGREDRTEEAAVGHGAVRICQAMCDPRLGSRGGGEHAQTLTKHCPHQLSLT